MSEKIVTLNEEVLSPVNALCVLHATGADCLLLFKSLHRQEGFQGPRRSLSVFLYPWQGRIRSGASGPENAGF